MQLEQEYEEKQMVVHEKHDLEGLIATLCEQVIWDSGTDRLTHTHGYILNIIIHFVIRVTIKL